jgi:hypothetical protein
MYRPLRHTLNKQLYGRKIIVANQISDMVSLDNIRVVRLQQNLATLERRCKERPIPLSDDCAISEML